MKRKQKKQRQFLLKSSQFFFGLTILLFLYAMLIQLVWNWYVANLYDIPMLSFKSAIGVSLLALLIIPFHVSKEKQTFDEWKDVFWLQLTKVILLFGLAVTLWIGFRWM